MLQGLMSALQGIITSFRGSKATLNRAIEELGSAIQRSLLEADVPREVTERIVGGIKTQLHDPAFARGLAQRERAARALALQLEQILKVSGSGLTWTGSPKCCVFVGLQGAGKTTTLIKVAAALMRQRAKAGSQRPLMVASVDFDRPAAREQLAILAQRSGVVWYAATTTTPRSAAVEIAQEARRRGVDLLLDTAGRMHTDEALLTELRDVSAACRADYHVLVLDGMMGQAALAAARAFHERLALTGGIITKLDSDAPGGVVLAFSAVVGKPILWVGMGERAEDLEQFNADRFVKRLLGEGDLAALCERAEFQLEKAPVAAGGLNSFSLEMFRDQMRMIQKMGSLRSLMGYLPGAAGLALSPDQLKAGDVKCARYGVIIDSMTPKERRNPALIQVSRRRRIARGSGSKEAEVAELLQTFEQMKQYAKLMNMTLMKR